MTNIEWTNITWNPVSGCSKISPGCNNCYAERMAKRLSGRYGYPKQPDHFNVTLHEKKLQQPSTLKKPHMIFVCSMGDLFHEDVPADYITHIFDIMQSTPHHTYQVLTKRPARMLSVLFGEEGRWYLGGGDFIPNVWLGVTTENQEFANKRIPYLMQATGFIKFISVEPMLGSVDLSLYQPFVRNHPIDFVRARGILAGKIDWVICGGETGPNARPLTSSWAVNLFNQCKSSGVPFFFKHPGSTFKGDHFSLPNSKSFPSPILIKASS